MELEQRNNARIAYLKVFHLFLLSMKIRVVPFLPDLYRVLEAYVSSAISTVLTARSAEVVRFSFLAISAAAIIYPLPQVLEDVLKFCWPYIQLHPTDFTWVLLKIICHLPSSDCSKVANCLHQLGNISPDSRLHLVSLLDSDATGKLNHYKAYLR